MPSVAKIFRSFTRVSLPGLARAKSTELSGFLAYTSTTSSNTSTTSGQSHRSTELDLGLLTFSAEDDQGVDGHSNVLERNDYFAIVI